MADVGPPQRPIIDRSLRIPLRTVISRVFNGKIEESFMRSFVAIALVICGTLLAVAPAASVFLQEREIAQAVSQRGVTPYVPQPLGEEYCLGSWMLGGAMIGFGIIGGWRQSSANGQSAVTDNKPAIARAVG
jgi:hypothetical protein